MKFTDFSARRAVAVLVGALILVGGSLHFGGGITDLRAENRDLRVANKVLQERLKANEFSEMPEKPLTNVVVPTRVPVPFDVRTATSDAVQAELDRLKKEFDDLHEADLVARGFPPRKVQLPR